MMIGMDFESEMQDDDTTPTCPANLEWHPAHSLCLAAAEEQCGMGEVYDQDMG